MHFQKKKEIVGLWGVFDFPYLHSYAVPVGVVLSSVQGYTVACMHARNPYNYAFIWDVVKVLRAGPPLLSSRKS